jgi:DNA-binding transcriptional regulator YiaG
MGKVETTIRSEITRLAKREVRKISLPLSRDVRMLKGTMLHMRKAVQALERLAAKQQALGGKEKKQLEATPEEVEISRFSPRLFRSLRKRLGISQKELATLVGVTVGAVHQWESGKFQPRDEKKGTLVALRKLGRREVRELLEGKSSEPAAPRRQKRKASPRGKKRRAR